MSSHRPRRAAREHRRDAAAGFAGLRSLAELRHQAERASQSCRGARRASAAGLAELQRSFAGLRQQASQLRRALAAGFTELPRSVEDGCSEGTDDVLRLNCHIAAATKSSIVACSAVVDSCEGTVVQVGSTAVGEGVSLVSLKHGLINFDRHAQWIWLRAHNEPEAPDTSL